MVRTWQTLLQLLWPHDGASPAKAVTNSMSIYKSTHYLFSYKEPHVQTLIKRTKYQADQIAAKRLAAHLDTYFTNLKNEYAIIPMPVSYKRWRARGYNHIELICKHSSYASQVRTDILKKSQHTKQQTQVSKTERIAQQQGTFTCSVTNSQTLPNTVILLDDVVTTGATMAAARATLQANLQPDTKLICVAIAH
jgi:ComF family protein